MQNNATVTSSRQRWALVVAVVASMGCSSSSAPASVPLEDLCARFSEVDCRGDQTCCTDATQRFASTDACMTQLMSRCMDAFMGVAFSDGRLRYDASAGGALIAMASSTVDTCDVRFAELDESEVFVGTLAAGADCSPAGMDWSPGFACMPGTHCSVMVGPTETGICRADSTLGEPCDGGLCADGLYCDTSGPTGMGTCQPKKADGAACITENECLGRSCPVDTCATRTPLTVNEAFCQNSRPTP